MPGDVDRYSIRGGEAGYDRLLLLARKAWPATSELLDRAGVSPGMRCIDIGCGSGAVTLQIARKVGPKGSAVGLDMETVNVENAREAAMAQGVSNIEFRQQRVQGWAETDAYDVVYSRFLLQHLGDPVNLLRRMWSALRPGGVLIIEDADHEGWACYPPNPGFEFYRRTLMEVIDRHGGDHAIGRKLVSHFRAAGTAKPLLNVVVRAFVEGDEKALPWLTIDATSEAIVKEGIATRADTDAALRDLKAFTDDPTTLIAGPAIFQVYSRR